MKKLFALVAATMCAASLSVYANTATHAQTKANKEQAEADYKEAKARCKTMTGADKRACVKQAKADYKAAKSTAKTDAKAEVANNTAK